MPRPQNKAEILAESRKEREKLDNLLATLTSEQMTDPGALGDWSVKDVLAHLYEWEQMVLGWLSAAEHGETPSVPAEGYKWSQLPALNEEIRQKHGSRSLNEMHKMYQESYAQIMKTIESISEDEMFTPGLHRWMNKNTLGTYFVSATSSHYRWALKELKKGIRAKSK
ncbi:MAG: ClbS/DfsB family four-helix bundle protein [Anaerolineales bacterium]